MHRQNDAHNLVLLIGILLGSVSLVTSKCDGVCVKLHECENTFGGANLVSLRFGEEDYVEVECPHYLEVCCDVDSVVTTRAPPVDTTDDSKNYTSLAPKALNNTRSDESPAESSESNSLEDNHPIKSFGECGIRNPEGVFFKTTSSTSKEAEFGEFPWMVAILQNQLDPEEPESSYVCGGSLIAAGVVLTAAHCVMNKVSQNLTVRAGEWDTMTSYEPFPHQEEPVSRIVLHPHFNRKLLFNNVALLVLTSSFSPAENVQLACLPPQGMVFTNSDCFVTGWGKLAFGAQSYHNILKRVPLPMVPKSECLTALRATRLGPKFRLHASFICAGGEKGIDSCTGDGGSPLVCPVAESVNKYYQAGIVAWGIGCAREGIPAVYVRTSLYTQWIGDEVDRIKSESVD